MKLDKETWMCERKRERIQYWVDRSGGVGGEENHAQNILNEKVYVVIKEFPNLSKDMQWFISTVSHAETWFPVYWEVRSSEIYLDEGLETS